MKEIKGVFSGPVRRRLSPDDEFFEEGNVQRALLSKMSVFALLEEREQREDGLEDMETFGGHQTAYECTFHDCSTVFSSLKRLEYHYETSHRNRCATCGRSFPTHRLLDLHLSEAHDSFFKAMAGRKPMYVCLVEGCKEAFWSTGKRHAHLVGIHRYPERFDFSRRSLARTTKSGSGKTKRTTSLRKKQTRERRQQEQQRDEQAAEAGATGSTKSVTAPAIDTGDEIGGGDVEAIASADLGEYRAAVSGEVEGATAARVENGGRLAAGDGDMDVEYDAEVFAGSRAAAPRNQANGATGPRQRAPRKCKFWRTSGGCRAGRDCMFRHDAAGHRGAAVGRLNDTEQGAGAKLETAEGRASVDGRGDSNPVASEAGVIECGLDVAGVDGLVNGLRKLSIPTHLSFGRTGRRGKLLGSVTR